MSQIESEKLKSQHKYWHSNLKLLVVILSVWFLVSYGCGIIFRDALDQFSIGGAPLGFWFAQQGSIICFLILLFTYKVMMNKLDHKYGYDEEVK